jgi:hypothetical protein
MPPLDPDLLSITSSTGNGTISHPLFGTYDYEVKPDQWVNMDADAIIRPVWSSSKTLSSATNVLWSGSIKDVTVEERWTQPLSMTLRMFRVLATLYMNPIDPAVGYCTWYPNYINGHSYYVIPASLSVGDSTNFVFDDIVNTKNEYGNGNGWLTSPVTFALRLVRRLDYSQVVSISNGVVTSGA